MSEDFKAYVKVILGIFLGIILLISFDIIRPFVANDEYYIVETVINGDKNIGYKTIHSHICSQGRDSKAWFKIKHSKYDFILEDDTYICKYCFSPEEAEKMLMIHKYNLKAIKEHYINVYHSFEKVDSAMMKYNCNANLGEIYYGE